jgi:hypothetical protein
MALLSTHPAQPSTPRINRLRQARRQLLVGASALLDATPMLSAGDYLVAAKTIDLCDFLLIRLARAERRLGA